MRLHHVGIVVPAIAPEARWLVDALGYTARSEIIHDPFQTAFVQFLKLDADSSYLELVEPDGPESKLAGALKRGGGLNHLCYAVENINTTCAQLRDQGMIVIQGPAPAVAFPGRRVAWLMGGQRVLTEVVEDGVDHWEAEHREP